jgi:hypothetical protein
MILASVRSTGTRFWESVFKKHMRVFRLHGTPLGINLQEGLHVSHVEPVHMLCVETRAKYYPLYLPMRHPMRVAESWIKRGWELNHMFLAEWHNLFWLQERYDGHWLPIDTEDRDERLKPFKTDWKPYKQTETKHQYKSGMTLDDVRAHFKLMPFEQFGYNLEDEK